MSQRIRIKDIAEKAGVSVGTVDRIIHNRPNVSPKARAKVEKVLKEINYQPNMYASALAYNKSYTFYLLMPKHESEAYWQEIEEGAMDACEARRDFHIDVRLMFYERSDEASFSSAFECVIENNPNGVIVIPSDIDTTKRYTDILHELNIPFVLLDSYMPILEPLSFFGQDSFKSGYFAARMLMLIAREEKKIMLMKLTKNGRVASEQQENREVGFRHYMSRYFPTTEIVDLEMPIGCEKHGYDSILGKFFSENKDIHHCITMCSKAHIVGEYLLRSGCRDVQIMGYDMVDKNAECMKRGSISFLIAQHAYVQGFSSVNTLFRAIVLKQPVKPINYMPIELLTKENVDFYNRAQI
ncbi:MAG: substrate-binding domain-containing protein [Prevotella sp.]|uniref:LacI family DNA-binding transcriptional regulator n=1 Tax=Prevotella sp. TaxID=59823 RepID=UPI002A29EACF|nr:substrate-binding domain-containing protein [Prevotella sp.]MDD7318141.1 substrate-binding domain-containing protein [Prevotellaceae bacterium]MDY4020970.1 substrate-binding domain-containing protein [Prevotella sp.]